MPKLIWPDGVYFQAKHNVFNSLTWGPDGWLYGCNGIIATSRIGRPGTPDKDRTPMNCGVWRYHPTKKKFEVVAHGTTNPWGLDFDEYGEMFVTNCVIDHLWHIVPGGHYERMYGEDLNPHVYKLMPSICDHKHWGGGSWTSSRRPLPSPPGRGAGGEGERQDAYKVHSIAGGGHAHAGCMIYLGDNWPARYRGGVFMCNLHGSRINHDLLERNGSTYVARHCKDFMLANDPWFRGLAIQYGPDGGVYLSDWTDTGECHNYKIADQTNGRIYKVVYDHHHHARKGIPPEGGTKLLPPAVTAFTGDLAKLSDLELARLHRHKNQWFVRHARRLLQERALTRKIDPEAIKELVDPLTRTQRNLWTRYVIDELPTSELVTIVANRDELEPFRVCALRLVLDGRKLKPEEMNVLSKVAHAETSAWMRLHFLSSSQRFPADDRILPINRSDATDPFLPLMFWYAIKEYPEHHWHSHIPLVREFAARRATMLPGDFLDQILAEMKGMDAGQHRDLLRGIQEGFGGQRRVIMPFSWKDAYPLLIASPLPEVRERALALAVQLGDERAFALLRKIVPDRAEPLKERESALKTLLFQQKADLVPVLHDLLSDESMRGHAIRGLAAFDHADTPARLIDGYAKWNADERADVIQTLASRGNYVKALVGALEKNAIPRSDLNAFTIRQLHTVVSRSGDRDTALALAKVVGEVRPASADKAKLLAKFKSELTPVMLKKANLANGRALYAKNCASCHRLFGDGGDIGPDLTGAQRTSLDYVLENVLDPSAIVPREFQVTVIETKKGRVINGMIRKETDAALTLQTPNELIVVPKMDIESRTSTKLSMMPEGVFEQMRLEEVRDLVAYLASPAQVAQKK